jgi:protein-tyrosine phosphatase
MKQESGSPLKSSDKKKKELKTMPPILKNLKEHFNYEFDYEVNSIKLDENPELNSKMYYFDKKTRSYRIVNYNTFWDSLCMNYLEEEHKVKKVKKSVNKAWCLKRLVSKKKRRFENEQFDLDMAYVTQRVIAMGYPATGMEGIYRNSIEDVTRFFSIYHNDNVKIYNLCIEKERIYQKNLFSKSSVGLFPAKDHNPCPIKLILEFCVDICLFLIKNPEGVAAIHCKAGKGRTGVMICSYLIFSGLCETSEEAFKHYALSRTYNKKGVTIPSQIRYVQYFESFLVTNFSPPYIFLIPKIVKYHIKLDTKNILQNFLNDKSYFICPNIFNLKKIKVGPLNSEALLDFQVCDFMTNILDYQNTRTTSHKLDEEGQSFYYVTCEFQDKININSDIKINMKGGGLDFYIWVNLWYSTLELIKRFLDKFHSDLMENHRQRGRTKSIKNPEKVLKIIEGMLNTLF